MGYDDIDKDALDTSKKILIVVFIIFIASLNIIWFIRLLKCGHLVQSPRRYILVCLALGDVFFAVYALVILGRKFYRDSYIGDSCSQSKTSQVYVQTYFPFVYGMSLLCLIIEIVSRRRVSSLGESVKVACVVYGAVPWILGLVIVLPMALAGIDWTNCWYPHGFGQFRAQALEVVAVIVPAVLCFLALIGLYSGQHEVLPDFHARTEVSPSAAGSSELDNLHNQQLFSPVPSAPTFENTTGFGSKSDAPPAYDQIFGQNPTPPPSGYGSAVVQWPQSHPGAMSGYPPTGSGYGMTGYHHPGGNNHYPTPDTNIPPTHQAFYTQPQHAFGPQQQPQHTHPVHPSSQTAHQPQHTTFTLSPQPPTDFRRAEMATEKAILVKAILAYIVFVVPGTVYNLVISYTDLDLEVVTGLALFWLFFWLQLLRGLVLPIIWQNPRYECQ